MTRVLAVLLALLLSLPARADMFQNASNAKLPDAMTKLASQGVNMSAVTVKPALTQSPGSMVLTGGGWSINNWFGGGFGGQGAQWLFGSKDNPITAGGSPVVIGVVQAIPKENCANNSAATGCNSALLLQNMGTAASTMVSSGLTAYVETQATVGVGIGNAQAVNAIGVASATSNAAGMGAYINGVRLGTSGHIRGMELRATNAADADCLPSNHQFISNCMGLWMSLAGPIGVGPRRLISSAIQIGVPLNYYGGAREGLIFGINSITEKTFADRTSSETSIYIDGQHDVALQTTTSLAGKVLLGTPASYAGPGETPFARAVQIYSGAVQIGAHAPDINPPQLTLTKSRHDTVGSHTAVQSNDHLGQLVFSGSDGTLYKNAAAMILGTVAGPVSTGIVPTKLTFWTSNLSGVSTEVMSIYRGERVDITGSLLVNGAPVTAGLMAPQMVFYGDSLTKANYAQFITLSKYSTGFTASSGLVEKDFATQVSGNGGLNALTGLTYAPELLDPYYQSRAQLNIVLIWLGTNDIALTAATPATTWTRIQNLAASAKAKGFKVCVGTSISRGNPVGTDTNLTILNGLITAGWAGAGINCLVDFASDGNLAPNGTNNANLTYYNADTVHLNEAGQQLAAAVAQTALNTYIATFTGPTPLEFNAPGNVTAAALATAGTIAGSICRTATGLFIYKPGANCF